MMTLSVVMTSYNGEYFIAKQLESISKQTRTPDELIISDDNSSDNTLGIAKDCVKLYPFETKIIANSKNLGFSRNFFSAIEQATGDLIALCDQDDIWYPQKLKVLESTLTGDPNLSCVVHSSNVVDSQLNSLNKIEPRFKKPRTLAPADYRPLRPLPGRNMLLRSQDLKDCLKIFNSFPRTLKKIDEIGHDTFITIILGATSFIKLIPEVLSSYRIHSSNASGLTIESADIKGIRGKMSRRLDPSALEFDLSLCQEVLELFRWIIETRSSLGLSIPKPSPRAIARYENFYNIAKRRFEYSRQTSLSKLTLALLTNTLKGDYNDPCGYGVKSLFRDMQLLATKLVKTIIERPENN